MRSAPRGGRYSPARRQFRLERTGRTRRSLCPDVRLENPYQKTGIDILHIPYRGSSQALTDWLGDHIDMLATNLPTVLPAIKDRLVVALAMTTTQCSALAPDVPTLDEAGVDGIDVTSWYGMLAPHAIPDDVRDAMKDPALQEKLLLQGLNVMIEAPDVFSTLIRSETALWASVIKSQDIAIQ